MLKKKLLETPTFSLLFGTPSGKIQLQIKGWHRCFEELYLRQLLLRQFQCFHHPELIFQIVLLDGK